ncbi:MAG: translation initiation factor IF-2 subunit gamma [Candidatus Lokiarchaeota archaeon]|nr:translation initiation factor IF-2 subunit gamma [Candidatus Lokiarchaeota archaeon]
MPKEEFSATDKSKITMEEADKLQAEMNLGTCGHVDHGKTTLTQALTGVRTDRHSEELERGISIKLGYADTVIGRCVNCPEPDCFWTKEMIKQEYAKKGVASKDVDLNKCPTCGGHIKVLRKISFVDSPGHEILMATMLSGASLMDGAMLLIAADEKVPQPQTREHLAALGVMNLKNIVVVQNKVDAQPREKVIENYQAIKAFLKGSVAEKAPVVPVSAVFKANLHELVQFIEKYVPTPARDPSKPTRFFIARSFDVNRPGTKIQKLQGGVIGGSLGGGMFKKGDEIEIKPGVKAEDKYIELTSTIDSISTGSALTERAGPGGLLGIKTTLDPSITKSDGLIGCLMGRKGELPPSTDNITISTQLLDRVVGTADGSARVEPLRVGENIMVSIGTMTTLGAITSLSKGKARLRLVRRVCSDTGMLLAISRQVNNRWRLVGYGRLEENQ